VFSFTAVDNAALQTTWPGIAKLRSSFVTSQDTKGHPARQWGPALLGVQFHRLLRRFDLRAEDVLLAFVPRSVVLLGRRQRFVAQEFLDIPDIDSRLEQLHGCGIAEAMRTTVRDSCIDEYFLQIV